MKTHITYDKSKPVYRGSVQNLYPVHGDKNMLVCETTDNGSVFDIGRMFSIPRSGTARTVFRHCLYQELEIPETWKGLSALQHLDETTTRIVEELLQKFRQIGMRTHHYGMLDHVGAVCTRELPSPASNLTVIEKFPVYMPTSIRYLKGSLYHYGGCAQAERYVIPLEYIIRFGVTAQSSIMQTYNAMGHVQQQQYLHEIGVDALRANDQFAFPLFDFSTKYEPIDRNISDQEALFVSGLPASQFVNTVYTALLVGCVVSQSVKRCGLCLWDLKLEFAVDGADIVLVDTIDQDSLRATTTCEYRGSCYQVSFSKQAIRDYYQIMHPDWYQAVRKVRQRNVMVAYAQDAYPPAPEIDPVFINIQARKIELMAESLRKNTSYSDKFHFLALEETKYYLQSRGKKLFYQRNCV